MDKSLIPSVKKQALVLEKLINNFFSWIDSHVELMLELAGELDFKEIKSTAIYLDQYWYIDLLETGKLNEIYAKVSKQWIAYYEEMFKDKHYNKLPAKTSVKLENIASVFKNFKSITVWIIAILTLFWISSWTIEDFFKSYWVNITLDQGIDKNTTVTWNDWNIINDKP